MTLVIVVANVNIMARNVRIVTKDIITPPTVHVLVSTGVNPSFAKY